MEQDIRVTAMEAAILPPEKDIVPSNVCDEKHKGLEKLCDEKHKAIQGDIDCLFEKVNKKAEKDDMEKKADADMVKSIRNLQYAILLALLGQFLYVIFSR
jgi:hypothetical protein